jgi:hypothetical protein
VKILPVTLSRRLFPAFWKLPVTLKVVPKAAVTLKIVPESGHECTLEKFNR